jgi:hypothetical protein
MSNSNHGSKRKRRSKALPVLGAAGLSLSLPGSRVLAASSRLELKQA